MYISAKVYRNERKTRRGDKLAVFHRRDTKTRNIIVNLENLCVSVSLW
jgi:hypothetical protein